MRLTPAMTDEQNDSLARLKGLTVKPGKSQDPILWLHCSFNHVICSFSLERDQLTSLVTVDKQSSVDGILNQVKCVVLDHTCDLLVSRHAGKQIE